MANGLHVRKRFSFWICVAAALFLAACAIAPAPAPSTIIRTVFDLPDGHAGFRNLLIVSVAGDYESRALYERKLTAAFDDLSGSTIAYFAVVGRRPMLTRTALETAILSREFDAVLLTRQKNQEREDLVANRPVGRGFDLFNYDYPELNGGASIEQASGITFVTELYSTSDYRKIWAIESLSFNKNTATELIEEQAAMVAAQMKEDGIVAP